MFKKKNINHSISIYLILELLGYIVILQLRTQHGNGIFTYTGFLRLQTAFGSKVQQSPLQQRITLLYPVISLKFSGCSYK